MSEGENSVFWGATLVTATAGMPNTVKLEDGSAAQTVGGKSP